MLSNQKYRISNIAKDFDVKSKELIELLDSYGFTGRTHMAVLTPDEFGIIFRGTMEREEIFLFLNDLKNNYSVATPDGERQTVTIGMATAFEDASRCAELVRKADGALFRAKVAGGNKVAMAKEEKMVPKTSHFTQDQLQRLAKLAKREGVGEAILLREAVDLLLKKYDI